jgi:hypothetical protein
MRVATYDEAMQAESAIAELLDKLKTPPSAGAYALLSLAFKSLLVNGVSRDAALDMISAVFAGIYTGSN